MTISSVLRKAGPYTGNGSTKQFPFAFKVFSSTDVVVVRTDPNALESTLTLGADYSVTLNSDQDASPGGTVVVFSAPLPAYLLTIASGVPNLQTLDLTNQGGFYPRVINTALDRLTIQIQQVAEEVSRTFKVPLSSAVGPGNSVADYVNQAVDSATEAASSAVTSGSYSAQSAGFAANSQSAALASAASASAASASAQAATTPTAAALVAYLDNFFPVSELMPFVGMYVLGGWDLGDITPASPFTNETTSRRASLSGGGSSFDFGTVP